MKPKYLPSICMLSAASRAHILITHPTPYGQSSLNNSPLAADGSDFPCKQRPGVYDQESPSTIIRIGSSQYLSFMGSAVHGGGSCQVSVTYDLHPTKTSTFKVIHSWEGGCPAEGQTGNIAGEGANYKDPMPYNFTIPSSLNVGNATLAWTWFNKVGNREMYMNCAPITITSGSSKREIESGTSARDEAALTDLPNMFLANIGNQCTTISDEDTKFPDPGQYLDELGLSTATPVPATGAGCATAVAMAAAQTASVSAGVTPAAAESHPTASLGGVYASVPVFSSQAAVTTTPVSSSQAPESPTSASGAATSSILSTVAPSSTATAGSSGEVTLGTACTSEGMFNCISGSSFQQCASGTWSVVQQLAAGTNCSPGQTMDLSIVASQNKRSVRFSRKYSRRLQ